jgi:hypothetical protein
MMARMILQISLGINQYPMMEMACAERVRSAQRLKIELTLR